MNKLNLGCGKDIKEGYINSDIIYMEGVDVVLDLDKTPYDFKDESFEEILCLGVFDYLNNLDAIIIELWRILKPGGMVKIHVGHFSSVSQYDQLTKKRGFSINSFREYDTEKLIYKKGFHNFNNKYFFKIKRQIIFSKFHRIFGLEFLFNLMPSIYELYLSGIFPARRIEFELTKEKSK